ncbi:PKD domain-containing protein [Flexithrix dorotheae]|uniref:PKD domain-containing protein n=1 Tax=Flexithrix dorotheae TaxID=70993 RepID=UPI00036BB28D|nr:PKD domain-containing protein [Flexithrix dorotheae]
MKSIYLILICFIAVSCEFRWEDSMVANVPPEITFIKNGETIDPETGEPYKTMKDSLKIGLKSKATSVTFYYEVRDENLSEVSYEAPDGEMLSSDKLENTNDQYQAVYRPGRVGNNEIKIIAKDEFGATSNIFLNLIVYENLPPVAMYAYTKKGIIRPGHFEFSGAPSYDQDEKYGGDIVHYQFEIDGVEIPSPDPIVEYIFQEEGQHEIKLKVQDNDGEWSEELRELITIEF